MNDDEAAQRRAGFAGRRPYDVIDGRRDPHLYFAWELFDSVVTNAYADDPHVREHWRGAYENERREAGLPQDFWQELEPIVAALRADRRRERELGRSGVPVTQVRAERHALGVQLCRDRHAALIEARARFGPALETFLYANARGMSSAVYEKPASVALSVAKGTCE